MKAALVCIVLAGGFLVGVPAGAQNMQPNAGSGSRTFVPNQRNTNVPSNQASHARRNTPAQNRAAFCRNNPGKCNNGYPRNGSGYNPYQVYPYVNIPSEYVNQALASPGPHASHLPNNHTNTGGQVFEHYDNR